MNKTREITLYEVKQMLGEALFERSYEAYLKNNLTGFESPIYSDVLYLRGTMGRYNAYVDLHPNGDVVANCDCGFCRDSFCVHTGALLIKYAVRNGKKSRYEDVATEENAQRLLGAYREGSAAHASEAAYNLIPVLDIEGGQAYASFKISDGDKSYMIMGLRAFTRNMQEHTPAFYGKLFFDHVMDALDLRSRALCRMIMSYALGIETMLNGKKYDVVYHFGDIRSIALSGESFDRIFDLFMGEKLPVKAGGQRLLCEEDPGDLFDIQRQDNSLTVSGRTDIQLYHSGSHSYILTDKKLCRVSSAFQNDLVPLVDTLSRVTAPIRLERKNAEEFCLTVAPRISAYASGDALNALVPFLPEELQVRYLVDMPEREKMTCRPNFNYTGRFVDFRAGKDAYPDIRRNFVREKDALQALEQLSFDPPEDGSDAYTLCDEDKMFELIKNGGELLNAYGEVFISDRLRKLMSTKTPKPTVRARINHGMLDLTLDTDEFPVEEMEKLMRAVREKRKYYRLESGSFVNLENGQFSAFTQTSDSLGLDIKNLSQKGATLPLYKALFLDEALKNEKSLNLEKNADYRRLLRDFKTVEEGEFPLPERLENILRDYQKTGYTWLRTLDKYGFGGILADDMGLGKTLQVLAFLAGIRQDGAVGPALIACPASVVATWGSEAERWVPEMRVALLTGGAGERAKVIRQANAYDLLVTGYDSLRNDIEYHEKNFYRVCVLDEAQYIKNRETKLKKSVDRLGARTKLALSGTPVENRLSELYSIFEFIMPEYLGSYTSFRRRYEIPITEQDDPVAKSTLSKLVRPFILRRMKKDVLSELPPKTETNCYVQMGERQRKLYVAYANEVEQKLLSAEPSDRFKLLAMLTRLRQICCDPALVYEDYEDDSCKLDECERMVEELIENEHRVLIFSQFTTMLERIEDRLINKGISSFTLRGDTPLDERVRLMKRFNAGECSVFLISLKAGGTGINLTGADTVIHYDPWWNLAAQNQATDRCYRIGQERPVQVYKLIASDTIEENIVKLQYKKLDLANVVTENADGGLMNMSVEELMQLIK